MKTQETSHGGLVWVGTYSTYQEAQAASKNYTNLNLFGNLNWLEKQASLRIKNKKRETGTDLPRLTLLPMFITSYAHSTIIDFGGGSGWVFDACMTARASIERYEVVELAPVVQHFTTTANHQLIFTEVNDFISGLERRFDILYANSSLQYSADNSTFIAVVKQGTPSFILLDQMLWSRGNSDWFTVQINSDEPVVSRFASIQKLTFELQLLGYQLAWQVSISGTEDSKFPDMSKFRSTHKIQSRLSLLFYKIPIDNSKKVC